MGISFGKEKMKTREWSTFFFFFFQKCSFWTYIKKQAHSLFGAWSFLLVHFQFTPSEGSKDFDNWFLTKSDHGKRPSSMVWLHGPWCSPTLRIHCIAIFQNCWTGTPLPLGPCVGHWGCSLQPRMMWKATLIDYAHFNERGHPTTSYTWTGWVWQKTGWRSRFQENYWSL